MQRVHRFLRDQAIKFSVIGAVIVAGLLIFGPLLDLLLPTQPNIMIAVTILILTSVGWLLLDYLSEVKRLIKPAEIRFYPNQEEADRELRAFIDSARPGEADLLECSSATVYQNIISPLVTRGNKIRLLIQNPKVARGRFGPSAREERRICDQFAITLGSEPPVASYDKLRIRFYSEVPSLRGRKFGNKLINVGWYTYDLRPEETPVETNPVQIHGHNNPLLSIASTEKDFDIIESMFSKVFKNLWDSADLPKDICSACPEKQNRQCQVSDAWLDRVSRL